MKLKKSLNKKHFKKLAFALFGFIPLVAASCNTATSSNANTELISKKNGEAFATNFTLKNGVETALVSNEGSKKYLDELKNQAIFNFYQALKDNDDLSIRTSFYKNFLDTELKRIDDKLITAKNNVRNSNPINVNAQIQSQLLDPVGGSEFAYKKQKELSFVASSFADLLFSKFFLAVVENNNVVLPNQENINKVIKANGTNDPKFAFHKDGAFAFKDEKLDNFFANFQQFIFEQWKKAETPFLFNQVNWKFDNDQTALERIYTDNALNKTLSNTTIQASYAFPYFSNNETNSTKSNVAKFSEFTGMSQKYTDETSGLTIVPKGFSSDTNEASLSFSTNTSMIGAFDNSKSLALMNLLDEILDKSSDKKKPDGVKESTESSNTTKTNLLKKEDFTKTSVAGLDLITSNFVYKMQDELKPCPTPSAPSVTRAVMDTSSTPIKHLTIKNDLAKLILKDHTSLANCDLHVIDAFRVKQDNLKDFIFVRTNEGVSAYSIVGANLISGSKTLDQIKDKLADVVIYYYFQNKINNTTGLNFDLEGSLKSFYQSNADWLVYKFWEKNKDNADLNLVNFAFVNNNQTRYLSAVANYIYVTNYLAYKTQYQTSLNGYKNTYSSNFGPNIVRNGLASLFPYEIKEKSLNLFDVNQTSSSYKVNSYKALETLDLKNPFNNQRLNEQPDIWNNLGEAYKALLSEFNKVKETFNTSPLRSNDVSFAYSQYIYTNDYFINQALIAVLGNNQSFIAELAKIKLFESNINTNDNKLVNEISFETNQNWISANNLSLNSFNLANSVVDKSSIEQAIKDFYFKTDVDFNSGLNNIDPTKLTHPSASGSSAARSRVTRNSDGNNGIDKSFVTVKNTDLSDFYKSNWLSSISLLNTNNTKKYVQYLELILTLKYLFDNNAANFIAEFNSKLDNSSYNYLVFESSAHKDINKSITKPQDLLFNKDKTVISVNNNLVNAYSTINAKEPNKSVEIKVESENTANNLFSNSISSIFNNVSGINGFVGLVNPNNNKSNISSELDVALFTFPNQYNKSSKGAIANIAKDKADLLVKIDGYSFNAEVDNLINELLKFYPSNDALLKILANTDLAKKKEELKKLINDTNGNKLKTPNIDDLLKHNVGYITNENKLYNIIGNAYSYGAYILQLNSSNYADLNELKTNIENTYDMAKADNSQLDKTTFAKSIISTLAVMFASESAIKQKAINQIFNNENNKLEVYDQRIAMALDNDFSKTTKQ